MNRMSLNKTSWVKLLLMLSEVEVRDLCQSEKVVEAMRVLTVQVRSKCAHRVQLPALRVHPVASPAG